MAVFRKRAAAGSTGLDAGEETLAPESAWDAPEPAPAGSLHRPRAREEAPSFRLRDTPGDVPAPHSIRWSALLPARKWTRIAAACGTFVALACIAAIVFGTRSFLLHDDRFMIASSSQIQTTGNVHLTRAQVLSVFGEDVERNILKVPLAERRADLERLPWVQHAIVMRLLPNRLAVSIVERVPVAFVRQGTAIGLVDATGVLLDLPELSAGDPRYSFPVLSGLSVSDPASTRAARMEIYREFIKQIDSSGTKISDSLSEVDVTDPEDVKALIPSGGTDILVHFGDQDFMDRYRHFQDHLSEWKQQYPRLASADMRYERQVVLEMQQGVGVPVNDAGGASAPAVPTAEATPATITPTPTTPTRTTPTRTTPTPTTAAATPLHAAAAKSPAANHAVQPVPLKVSTPASRNASKLPGAPKLPTAVKSPSASNAKIFAALAAARKQSGDTAGRAQE